MRKDHRACACARVWTIPCGPSSYSVFPNPWLQRSYLSDLALASKEVKVILPISKSLTFRPPVLYEMGILELEARLPLRIITFNIRYATTSPTPREEPWEARCPRLLAQLRFGTAGRSAFVSVQEALARQVDDVQAGLGPSWAHIGVGRDDGDAAGEFSPVFYHAETWRCERSRTYWLSPTPEKPSRGWYVGCAHSSVPRSCEVAQAPARYGPGASRSLLQLSGCFQTRAYY